MGADAESEETCGSVSQQDVKQLKVGPQGFSINLSSNFFFLASPSQLLHVQTLFGIYIFQPEMFQDAFIQQLFSNMGLPCATNWSRIGAGDRKISKDSFQPSVSRGSGCRQGQVLQCCWWTAASGSLGRFYLQMQSPGSTPHYVTQNLCTRQEYFQQSPQVNIMLTKHLRATGNVTRCENVLSIMMVI